MYSPGKKGKEYTIIAMNDDELSADVAVRTEKVGYIIYKSPETRGSTGERFPIPAGGSIRVTNKSSSEFSQKPEVTFNLKAR